MVVDGPTAKLRGGIIDDNLKPLDWWIAKHNAYANREVADILLGHGSTDDALQGAASRRRWLKQQVYGRLPFGLRAGAYFFYRFILRLGCLDQRGARTFHVLQGFWYRYLVDAKLAETRRYMQDHKQPPDAALAAVLGLDLGATAPRRAKDAA